MKLQLLRVILRTGFNAFPASCCFLAPRFPFGLLSAPSPRLHPIRIHGTFIQTHARARAAASGSFLPAAGTPLASAGLTHPSREISRDGNLGSGSGQVTSRAAAPITPVCRAAASASWSTTAPGGELERLWVHPAGKEQRAKAEGNGTGRNFRHAWSSSACAPAVLDAARRCVEHSRSCTTPWAQPMDLDGTSADVNERSCGLHQLQLSFPDQLVCLRCQAHRQHHKICLLEQAVYLFAVSGTDSLLLFHFPSGERSISVMETFSSTMSPLYKLKDLIITTI